MKNGHKQDIQYRIALHALLSLSLMLTNSCSSNIGLMSEKNSWLVREMDGPGDFLQVYIVLQLSILLIAIVLGFFLGKAGQIISLVMHFIWIVSFRDYGFLTVLLLFSLFSIVSFLYNLIRGGAGQNQ